MSRQILNMFAIVLSIGVLAAGNLPPARAADAPAAAGFAAAGCQMYGGGVVDVVGHSAAYLFIGDRPACTDAARKQRFCAALQTRLGYVTVREQSEQAAEAVEIAKGMDANERANYLTQYPPRALERVIAACGLTQAQVKAKAVSEAQGNLYAGRLDALNEDLDFLRREAPSVIEPLWKRECEGRVVGTALSEQGIFPVFSGKNVAYKEFCAATTKFDKPRAPGRFGG